MKLVSFHLMPYRPLDLEEAAKHRSPWVVLPNRLYDPVKGAEEYARHIDALVYAEELGFDAIGVNEHHQTAYGLMPAPNLIASALIQRTKKIQIAILGRALPLVNNPIYIAEEFAMLDNLSKGRIIAGFVRSIGSEYHSSGVNPFFSDDFNRRGACTTGDCRQDTADHRMRRLHKFLHEIGAKILFVYKRELDARRSKVITGLNPPG
jgi:alkanesulfonate monooxygenase SsuD/methylene tetrahydromethanopterin reductase-like flavin-dependent oxidoreductase (luciferase family)